eukprot:14804607-Alexandrium_andersonii.AAC.1
MSASLVGSEMCIRDGHRRMSARRRVLGGAARQSSPSIEAVVVARSDRVVLRRPGTLPASPVAP